MSREDLKPEKIMLRTMSENPALDWNTRSRTCMGHEVTASWPRILPLVTGVNSKFNFAPAIVYRKRVGRRYEFSGFGTRFKSVRISL